jgi:hypothetical protein
MLLEYLEAGAVGSALTLLVVALSSRRTSAQRRAEVRASLAAQAVAYAEAIGGDGPEKLRHAVQAAGKLDLADNRRRDFTDGEFRIAIEHHLATKESP